MLVVVSPTKTMRSDGTRTPRNLPALYTYSECILEELKKLKEEDIQTLMKVNEKIAKENQERFQQICFDMHGTCALETYDGLQFKSMQLETLDEQAWEYLQKHMRILSGFYGVVRPLDAIYPYRLEMQAKLAVDGCKNLYTYWNDVIAKHCLDACKDNQTPVILSVASKEYEKAIQPYVPHGKFIQLVFKIEKQGKLKVESTQAKMARGAMIAFLAKHKAQTLEDVKKFDSDGYQYDESLSDDITFVFVKRTSI